MHKYLNNIKTAGLLLVTLMDRVFSPYSFVVIDILIG